MTSDGPKIAFRFDAGHAVGMGHLVRCLNLSHGLPDAVFVVNSAAATELRSRGIQADRILDAKQGWWTGVEGLTHVITDLNFGGGAPGAAEEVAALRTSGVHVTVIDSLVPDHFVTKVGSIPPNLLVSPYAHAKGLRPEPVADDWIVGAEYVVFSPEFIEAQKIAPKPIGDRILVTCGGSDPSNLSLLILNALAEVDLPIDLVVGPLYSDDLKEELHQTASCSDRVTLHDAPSTLVPLIESAGLVVGRPGLTRYEAAALGRSGLFLVEGSSYRDYFKAFDAAGIGRMCFAEDPGGADEFAQLLASLASNEGRAELMRINEIGLRSVDGLGAKRILDHIFQ